jgi:hypothetical protein
VGNDCFFRSSALARSLNFIVANAAATSKMQFFVGELASGQASLVLDNNLRVGILTATPATTFDVEGQVTQSTYVVRGVFTKVGIADNAATSIFTITTANEAGSTDGGGYSVFVHAVMGHEATNGSGSGSATKSFTAQFCRAMLGVGTGVNSAVSEVMETASAATTPAGRDIGAVTMTVVETSEYIQTIQFTVDLTGTAVSTAEAFVLVELVWTGFLTPPVLAAA